MYYTIQIDIVDLVYSGYIYNLTSKKLNRLAEILKEQEITAYRLSKDFGVAYDLVSSYTKNTRQPSVETMFKLAKTLKINPKDLINS